MVRHGGVVRRHPVALTPSLRPVSAAFLVFGAFWGVWAVAAADMERDLGVSHGGFGVLLSVALVGAAIANSVGGALAERLGTGPVLVVALAAWGALVLGDAAVRRPAVLGALVVATVAVGGLVDVVMNVAATAGLGDAPGAFVRFHARFNAGAAVGAAACGILSAHGDTWRWAWGAVGAAALVLAVACARTTLPAGQAGERVPLTGALALLRRERLVVLAAAFAVGAMVEGGVDLWGVLFLRDRFASGLRVGASSIVVAYLIAAAARVLLGPVAARRGAARGVTLGAAAAAAGLVLLAGAPGPWLSGAGLVVAAGGISLCWPLLLSHASAGTAHPGPTIGAVTGVGYLGFVLGPATVGTLASLVGLRAGLVLLALAALFVAVAPARWGRP